MNIICINYTPRDGDAMSGRADLVLGLEGGAALEVKGWAVYCADGERYINPPSVGRAGALSCIMRILGRRSREHFRVAALAAIDAYRAQEANQAAAA